MSVDGQGQRTIIVATAEKGWTEAIVEQIELCGGRARSATDTTMLRQVLDREFPVLVLLDRGLTGQWSTVVRHYKLLPQTSEIPIHLFGRPTPAASSPRGSELVAAGLIDGCWHDAAFWAKLPDLIEAHVNPPTIFPAGWDEPMSAQARLGLEEFNRGDYFEQHEYLEVAWVAEARPIRDLYQGILQVGLAFLQIERDNWRGALKMFRRGLPKLRTLPPVCRGIELAAFRNAAEQIHTEISALGPARLHDFDRRRFPRISYQ